MYNESRKEAFINEYGGTERSQYYVKAVFRKFEKMEEELDSDVCELPAKELQDIINSQAGTRSESSERVYVVLKKYVEWCRNKNIKINEDIFNIKTDIIETYKNQMFKSPNDLKEKLEHIFKMNELENDTVGVIYKAYIWMLYCGISNTDALEVNVDDVDLTEMKIRLGENRIYKLYEVSREVFTQACTIKEFRYRHGCYSEDIYRPRFEGKALIRTFKSERMPIDSIKSILTKLSVNSGVKLSYKKIFYSGLFYRMYIDEMEGSQISFSDYIDEEMKKEYSLNRNRTFNKVRNHKARALILDYEKWKAAFYK